MIDVTNRILLKIRSTRLSLLLFWSTFIMKISLSLRGIKTGGKLKFWGLACFVRHQNSKISIGAGCSFRSDRTSNLIGVNRPCIISTHSDAAEITIGQHCGFSGVTIGAKEKITIKNNVLAGANVVITDFDWHSVDPQLRRTDAGGSKPVVISDNVFIGVNCIILKGSSIGRNSVIGANSVVTGDIPENCIAAGNPARVIRSLEPGATKAAHKS